MNDFLLRSAGPDDLDGLVLLEHEVERALPCRDMFATDEREFYEPIVRGTGHILLAFDADGKLAGASVIRFPAADDPENLGLPLSLPPERLATVRHLESVFVRPDIRGKKLAERLVRENMHITEGCGRTLSMATVWPGNAASLKLHLNLGLHIRAFAFKYGGKPRFILMDGDRTAMDAAPVFVRAMDLNAHRAQLNAGMAGVAICTQPNSQDFLVEYRPVITS
ncbi:GNAT family N-acetyltransferase [uncultured Mailhella sp.]|uniref:GNAT family N-acetyltransferase n=1 Tax=uncultured Mailhella sp. TaxID=1981031 RepID=UPI0025E90B60|nr:GNAT family N-acetyltransferase [uncultured Mailhella sp.]